MRAGKTLLASSALAATVASMCLLSPLGGCTIVQEAGDGGGTVIGPGDSGSGGGDDGTTSQDSGGGEASAGEGGSGDDSGEASTSGDACAPCDVGNFDVPGNGCDDDCNGMVDDKPACDQGLMANGPASDFVKAMGLCQTATGASDPKWGVVSATYTNGYGLTTTPSDLQHSILAKYGATIVPREGSALGVISSGCAAEFDDCQMGDNQQFKGGHTPMQPSQGGAVPAGFPQAATGCPADSTNVNDVIDVSVKIKVPKNAQGLHYEFDFWSGEWPEYVCSPYNDSFIAFLQSAAFHGGMPANFSFDSMANPVSVNNAFFDRCTTNSFTCGNANDQPAPCPAGEGELMGTGFFDPHGTYCNGVNESSGGATGWLQSEAPVMPGEIITLDFIIWDTGDAAYDSVALVDNFEWKAGSTSVGTGRPQ